MDQVITLRSIGVPVATINSTISLAERRLIIEDLLSGHPRTRLLYVTPELCLSETFRRTLQTVHTQGELTHIAIDEAHCISQWGHDFRPAYKELSWFRRVLKNPSVPISAFTATATPRVRQDIITLLGLDASQLKIFNTPSARPNIHYEIRYLTDFASDPTCPEKFQIDDLVAWLNSIQARREARVGSADEVANLPPISGIVYVSLRAVSENLANALSNTSKYINAVAYHAGLSNEDRTRIQTMWTSPTSEFYQRNSPSELRPAFSLIVATTAFGMGIDNPHVRFVIHWSPPKTFEGFVQESGRAGRDGRAAASVVYYSPVERDRVLDRLKMDVESARKRDAAGNRRRSASSNSNPNNPNTGGNQSNLQTQQARVESFDKVVRYCETTTRCRHDLIGELFGDTDLQKMRSGSTTISDANTNTDSNTNAQNPEDNEGLCDFACDFCKEGHDAVAKRKEKMCAEPAPGDFMDLNFAYLMRCMFPSAFRGSNLMDMPGMCHECP